MKLNFKLKQGKEEHQKKDHPSIIDNIEHENMCSIYVCDTCKISISDAILHCNLCLKEYHPYCAHPLSNFPGKFPNQTYVCPNCIHNNNPSVYHFVSRAAYSLQTHHVYSTLKRHGNDRFQVVLTWNTRGVFVGLYV